MLSRDQKIHLMKEDCIMGNLCSHESFLSNLQAYTWLLQMEGWYLNFLGMLYDVMNVERRMPELGIMFTHYLIWALKPLDIDYKNLQNASYKNVK